MEITKLRTETGRVFANPSGTMTMEEYAVAPPSHGGPQYRWTHVNAKYPTTSYWNYDRNEGAKVGYAYDESGNIYRSLFQMGTLPINGARVLKATFFIVLDHSPTGDYTDTHLYNMPPIDPAVPLSWNDAAGWWRAGGWPDGSWLSQRTSRACTGCGQPNMTVEFGDKDPRSYPQRMRDRLQQIATSRTGFVTLGLRAPDESRAGKSQWKRFAPATARIVVEYNHQPRMPHAVNLDNPVPCGTQADPTPIATTTPQFSAVASDPNNQNLVTTLQIDRADGAPEYTVESAMTTSGAAFSWPEIPAGELVHGGVYSYRARTSDSLDTGPETPRCYFEVDTKDPGIPSIESADFPEDGSPMLPAYTTGTVTLRPAAGDQDIAEYRYGFGQDRTTLRVKANPDGSATIPLTVWPKPVTGIPAKELYVRAVDRAGNPSAPRSRTLSAYEGPAKPRQHGDANGDGRPDVSVVLDHGFGSTMVWNVIAKPDGFHAGVVAWSGGDSSWAVFRTRAVRGNFDDDGGTDLAVFREEAGRRVTLHVLKSEGDRYVSPNEPTWDSGAGSWPLSIARVMSGELDGDSKTDIAVQVNDGNGKWHVVVFPGGNLGTPTTWLQATGDWTRSAPVLADIDGDNKDDLVDMRNLTGCRTATSAYRSTGTAFETVARPMHDGNYCWDRSTPYAGDVDGDGRDDIVALYDYGPNDAGLWVFRSTGTALTPALWWRSNQFDPAKVTLTTGDYDVDGRDDAAIVYPVGDGGRQLWTVRSTGSAFAAPKLDWDEPRAGVASGPRWAIEHRSYELVARHSDKCLTVPGAGTANGLQFEQRTCANGLHQRYRLLRIAGTDRFEVKPVHSVKCLAVSGARPDDGTPVLQWDCAGTGDQQITVEYVEGTSYDTLVRVRFAHSEKCADVAAGGLGDGAEIVQMECKDGASQQWLLRPAYNPTQLGGGPFKIRAQISAGRVLDVTNCGTGNGADVRIWDYGPCGRWRLESLGDDTYRILDNNSGKALDIAGCNPVNGALVHLWTVGDSDCQRWRIEPSANGGYSILAIGTGRSLAVAACSAARGADVLIWQHNAAACQRWFLDPVL